MSDSDAQFGDDVYADGVEDTEEMDPIENLTGQDEEEPMDTGYSPPDAEPKGLRWGMTLAEEQAGEPLDMKLAEEEPEVGDNIDPAEEADPRSGRLVAPDEGAHDVEESDEIAFDAGLAGSAASAEEAAMHTVDEDALNEQDTNEDDIGDGA